MLRPITSIPYTSWIHLVKSVHLSEENNPLKVISTQ